jgi:hypothetical protein
MGKDWAQKFSNLGRFQQSDFVFHVNLFDIQYLTIAAFMAESPAPFLATISVWVPLGLWRRMGW